MNEPKPEKDIVILVGLNLGSDPNFDHHMEELEDLCQAVGYEVAGIATQSLPKPHSALYIGAGKVQEVREYAENLGADIVVFDDALSPSQVRNLNEAIGLPIMDRTAVILEIFASRAKTREARLQVELARYQYLLPRLVGMGQALSRQGGSTSSSAGARSNRGAGETRLELDRRRIEHRITELSREVEEVKKTTYYPAQKPRKIPPSPGVPGGLHQRRQIHDSKSVSLKIWKPRCEGYRDKDRSAGRYALCHTGHHRTETDASRQAALLSLRYCRIY